MPNFKSVSFSPCGARSGSLLLLLLFAVFASPAYSEAKIEDASMIDRLDARVMQTGSVAVSGSSIDWVKLNITIPQNTENQMVIDTLGKVRDEFGNSLWSYEEKNPNMFVYYLGENSVEVSSRHTQSLPPSYSIPDNAKRYMAATKGMQSNDARIQALAKNLAEGKRTDFEKIAALAIYVHETTNYTKSLGTTAKDALWVLDNKIGTCDEYSTLFIALSRALGYPARYVSGYAYGDGGWIPHAWAEVYLGKWVPVDATWLEVGWLDATHIAFHASGDNLVENTAQAYGIGTKTVNWLESETKIEVQAIEERKKTQEYTLTQTSTRLTPGEKTVVMLSIIPDEYSVAEASLEPCKGDEPILSIDSKKRTAALIPGQKKTLFWIVSAESGSLQKNMIYTCPLTLNSRLLGERRIDVVVDTSLEPDSVDLSAEAKSPTVLFGENETIFISAKRIEGRGNFKIGVVSEEYYGESTVSGSASERYSFAPTTTGHGRAAAFSSAGQAANISYEVVPSAGTRIAGADVPRAAKVGGTEKITVLVESPNALSQELRLSAKEGEKDITMQNFVLQSRANISFDYSPESAGEKTIRLLLSGTGASDLRIEKIRAYDVPEISATLTEDFKKNIARVRISSAKDSAENVSVRFLGAEKNIGEVSGEKDAEFAITGFGKSEAEITYYDASGNKYSIVVNLDVKKEGPIQRLIRSLLSFLGK